MTDFNVTVSVADNLEWSHLIQGVNLNGIEEQYHPKIRSHFSYLLRQASWKHGIDWLPSESKVTITVPNQYISERTVQPDGTYRDGLSNLLYSIIAEVDIQSVRRHFTSI